MLDEYGNDIELMKKYGQVDFDENYNTVESAPYTQSKKETVMAHSMIPQGWTEKDLEELSAMCIALTDDIYCEDCQVKSVLPGDKYCVGCITDIVDWLYTQEIDALAQQVAEKIALDKGLY